MAHIKCKRPDCDKPVDTGDVSTDIQLLQLYDTQVHGLANKTERPRRPELSMTGDAVEDKDWEQFVFKYEQYKLLADVKKDCTSRHLECLGNDVYSILFNTYSGDIKSQAEAVLLGNIKRLVVR